MSSAMRTLMPRAPWVELQRLPRAYVLACFALSFTLLSTNEASAYHWMQRHGYTGCATCHTDPSGSGLLEPYGSAMADEVLRTHYTSRTTEANYGGFAGGVVHFPQAVRMKGDFRLMSLATKAEGVPIERDLILMQSELAAGLRAGNFVASASLGYASQGGQFAAVSRFDKFNIVSRQHWLGFWDDDVLVRAGRINLPFGIRTVEHTLWVRDFTNTTINDDQMHGVSVFYGGDLIRAELMGIAGNFQIRPDQHRERGYSGYAEFNVASGLALGVSSLITHEELDQTLLEKTWRHAHGVMGRWATPFTPLVLASEFDYVLTSSKHSPHRKGVVGFVQADLEVMQGIHVLVTGENRNVGLDGTPTSLGAWLSYLWFFAPHADVRFDNIYYRLRSQSRTTDAYAQLVQLHMYL